MIYFILVWNVLIAVCWIVGTGVLLRLRASSFHRLGDRLIIAVWTGVVLLAITLLATSLVLPLSPLVGIIVAVTLSCAALSDHQVRAELMGLKQKISTATIAVGFALEAAIAALTSHEVTWIDTGLYHYGIIQWLAKFGTVPGLALLFSNLGFTSSWFALAAPLNSELLDARASAIINGFIFLIVLLHFCICLRRIGLKAAQVADWLIVCSLIFLTPFIATNNLLALILVSASPDLPVIFLPLIITWSIIIISNTDQQSNAQKLLQQETERVRLLPLILAIAAVTIKLTALPLLLVCLIFQTTSRKPVRQLFLSMALMVLLLTPFLAASVLTSGCPLYPSSAFCLNLPWAIPRQAAAATARGTHGWAPWSFSSLSNQNFGSLLFQWISSNKLNLAMAIFIILAIGFTLYGLAVPKLRRTPGYIWTILLSTSGIGFLWITAPFFRFALGYLILLPALSTAILLQASLFWDRLNFPQQIVNFVRLLNTRRAISLNLSFISAFVIILALAYSIQHTQILLPPPLKKVQFTQKQINDISYRSPVNDVCWSTEIPCAFKPEKIRLRDPAHRLQAGFIRSD
jgi:hypothetical protein